MATCLRLSLPLPPSRANARDHWAARNRKRRDYELTVYHELRFETILPPEYIRWATLLQARIVTKQHAPPEPMFGPARIFAAFFVHNRYDPDNLTALLKWPIDALVKASLLTNDDAAHVKYDPTPTQTIDRKHRHLELTIDDLAHEA